MRKSLICIVLLFALAAQAPVSAQESYTPQVGKFTALRAGNGIVTIIQSTPEGAHQWYRVDANDRLVDRGETVRSGSHEALVARLMSGGAGTPFDYWQGRNAFGGRGEITGNFSSREMELPSAASRERSRNCRDTFGRNPQLAIRACGEIIAGGGSRWTIASAHSSRGRAFEMLKQYDQAIADYTQSISMLSGTRSGAGSNTYYRRAAAYFIIGQIGPAIADLNAAIQNSPDFAEAYEMRGKILSRIGRLAEANADLKKAVELYAAAESAQERDRDVDDDSGEK